MEEARMKPIRPVLRALFIAALVLSFMAAAAGRAWADPIVVTDPVMAPADPIVVTDPVPADPAPSVDIPQLPTDSPDDPEFD